MHIKHWSHRHQMGVRDKQIINHDHKAFGLIKQEGQLAALSIGQTTHNDHL